MSGAQTLIKEYGGIGALITVLLGGGANIWQEGAEEAVSDQLRQADVVQDQKYDDLLQKYNDLNTEVALLRQRVNTR